MSYEIWLAGLLEGDGSFEMSKCSPQHTIPRIRLAMLDKDIIFKAAEYFGSNVSSYKTPKGDKTMWRTTIAKRDVVFPFLVKIYPWMGERRQEQIATMINYYFQNQLGRSRQEVCYR